ncbi:MAG TPA: YlxR family protein [Candidatus Baltobacterales bacterium]|nr:YlxR family protein [Candidatus Baltobacterales bacterium]
MTMGAHEPVRTCVGCRVEGNKQALIRVVRRAQGGAALDPSGQASGRGAYLHPDPACIESARKKRSLERALRTSIQSELWSELLPLP